jgi:hypothetical protein
MRGRAKTVNALVQAGAALNSVDKACRIPVRCCRVGVPLTHGAQNGRTALHRAARLRYRQADKVATFTELVRLGAEIDARDSVRPLCC